MNTASGRTYLPAAGHDIFLPFYDVMTELIGANRVRRALLDRLTFAPGSKALDIGCGTGTFVVLLKRLHPQVQVTGLDPDCKALARACRKAERAGTEVELVQGFSQELRFADGAFDHVFSSFMFHHLDADLKQATLRDVRRVLKPGGRFHLLDFGGSDSGRYGFLARLFHSHSRLRDNAESRILNLLQAAGFEGVRRPGEHKVLLGFGRALLYEAVAP
jgi:ubiquinone/menaquinone biosynthesis C-methylase UbiE